MYLDPKTTLNHAKENNYAIPAVNFIDQDTIKSYCEIAAKLNMPLIIALAESHLEFIDFDEAIALAKFYIQKTNVNAILHFDHGKTFSLIKKAIDSGFNSIMIDASDKSFEENVKITKEVVDYAHEKNIYVEAEIGHVGSGKVIGISCSTNDETKYTSLEEAKEFIKLTNADSLAVSIGTQHGTYIGDPIINFKRLKELKENLNIPLVLHGGSSSGDDNLNKCAKNGITKINIYTDFIKAAQEVDKKTDNYYEYKNNVRTAIKNKLEHYFKIFETEAIK